MLAGSGPVPNGINPLPPGELNFKLSGTGQEDRAHIRTNRATGPKVASLKQGIWAIIEHFTDSWQVSSPKCHLLHVATH